MAALLGANGDGFRAVSALVGPNVLGNVFSGLGGDGIAIYGAPSAAPRGPPRCRTRRRMPVRPAGSVI